MTETPDPSVMIVRLGREPQAPSLKGALEFLADVMRTLVAKEAGYGDIQDHVAVFAPKCTPEERIRTRLDEKLTRLKRLGIEAGDDEDTVRDVVGYLALLAGLRGRAPILSDAPADVKWEPVRTNIQHDDSTIFCPCDKCFAEAEAVRRAARYSETNIGEEIVKRAAQLCARFVSSGEEYCKNCGFAYAMHNDQAKAVP